MCRAGDSRLFISKDFIFETNLWASSMVGRKLKGGVILGYYDFIKHQWGQEGVEECVKVTGIDPKRIDAEKFYLSDFDETVLKWMSSTKGMDNVKKAGNHTVKNLGVLSYLVRYVSIQNLLRKAKENYEDTFEYGEISVLMDKFGKRASVIMKNANVIEESCVAWQGAFEGMMEVTRTKGSVKQNKYQFKGDDYDEFIIDWS